MITRYESLALHEVNILDELIDSLRYNREQENLRCDWQPDDDLEIPFYRFPLKAVRNLFDNIFQFHAVQQGNRTTSIQCNNDSSRTEFTIITPDFVDKTNSNQVRTKMSYAIKLAELIGVELTIFPLPGHRYFANLDNNTQSG